MHSAPHRTWGNARPLSRFAQLALEYLAAPDRERWIFVPHVITLHSPSDEPFIRETLAALRTAGPGEHADLLYDLRFYRRNNRIELRERIPEVLGAVHAFRAAVVGESVTRLGLGDHRYHFGAQIDPLAVPSLRAHRDMRDCALRPVREEDIFSLLRMRPPVLAA